MHSKTTSIRERIVLYLLWVQNISFFVMFFMCANVCSLFFIQGVHSLLYFTSIRAGVRGQREGLLREVTF